MWNDRFIDPCSVAQRACFDPATLTVASLASTAIGGAVSAAGTIAGGDAAAQAGQMQQQAANFQASQIEDNSRQAFASGQRQMLDTQEKTRLTLSTLRANAAGNGVNAADGSPASIAGAIAKRGSYNAAMDMFNGESSATGLLNQAAGVRYTGQAAAIEGQEKQSASLLAAAGTLAGTAGSMAKGYGSYAFPQSFRST
jgi:hypothetical protein